jgi:hypothetical protein
MGYELRIRHLPSAALHAHVLAIRVKDAPVRPPRLGRLLELEIPRDGSIRGRSSCFRSRLIAVWAGDVPSCVVLGRPATFRAHGRLPDALLCRGLQLVHQGVRLLGQGRYRYSLPWFGTARCCSGSRRRRHAHPRGPGTSRRGQRLVASTRCGIASRWLGSPNR